MGDVVRRLARYVAGLLYRMFVRAQVGAHEAPVVVLPHQVLHLQR